LLSTWPSQCDAWPVPDSSSYFSQVLAGRAYGSRTGDPDLILFELRARLEHGQATRSDCVGDGVVALQRAFGWEHGTGLVPAPIEFGWAVAPPPPTPTQSFYGWIHGDWILSWSHAPGTLTLYYQVPPMPVHYYPHRVELRFYGPCRLLITAEADQLDELVRSAGDILLASRGNPP
jgi:hypothetical protein